MTSEREEREREREKRAQLLRGGIVNRTYGRHKNLYIFLFLLKIFGPIYYVPPSIDAVAHLGHNRESRPVLSLHKVGDLGPRRGLLAAELVAGKRDDRQPVLAVPGAEGLQLAVVAVRVPTLACDVHDKHRLRKKTRE